MLMVDEIKKQIKIQISNLYALIISNSDYLPEPLITKMAF